eukprot:CAMPEP_0184669284 /NCGR_PEP_ID=MMETSP0308-20130426/76526_1 /TAXON_ID=38269 /ORGANISM="Gloeochaete witrockiana, Strain SAG 46.84" /LENGTH=62 /DNA_ID=CAMNT_0027115463 /DNA_START=489 /DNA_END=674 /DNA_ORIENTATION=+
MTSTPECGSSAAATVSISRAPVLMVAIGDQSHTSCEEVDEGARRLQTLRVQSPEAVTRVHSP